MRLIGPRLWAALSLGLATHLHAFAAVAPSRLEELSTGVNLGNWFSQAPYGEHYQHIYLRTWIAASEFVALQRNGIRHVRFPVEFEMFFDPSDPSHLRPEFLGDFDHALDEILGAGLAVIVDFHAREDTKLHLRDEDAFVESYAALWGAMAHHLQSRDPGRVFLETMNEPPAEIPLARWLSIQAKFVASMRAAAPHNTILVTSSRWDAVDTLVRLQPLPDQNLVYTFHFYDPMLFTHQGASWLKSGERLIAGLEYPTDPKNVDAIAAKLSDPKLAARVRSYHGSFEILKPRIEAAAAWGKLHHVPVYCGEFGAYAKVAPHRSRTEWIGNVRVLCEENRIGWAMWDYCGGFHLALGDTPGKRELDRDCLDALGLTAESVPDKPPVALGRGQFRGGTLSLIWTDGRHFIDHDLWCGGDDSEKYDGRFIFRVERPGRPPVDTEARGIDFIFTSDHQPWPICFCDLTHDGRVGFNLCLYGGCEKASVNVYAIRSDGHVDLLAGDLIHSLTGSYDDVGSSPNLKSVPGGFAYSYSYWAGSGHEMRATASWDAKAGKFSVSETEDPEPAKSLQ